MTGSHPNYTKYVEKKLDEIWESFEGSNLNNEETLELLFTKVIDLTDDLKDKMHIAYNQGGDGALNLDSYFKELLKNL